MKFTAFTKSLFSLGFIVFCSSDLQSQQIDVGPDELSSPTPMLSPEEEKAAFVRIWFAGIGGDGLQICLSNPSQAGEPLVIAKNPRNFSFSTGYRDVPAGKYSVLIVSEKLPESPLATVNADLRSKEFYTLLIQSHSGRPHITLIDDTLTSKRPKATSGTPTDPEYTRAMTVFHFAPEYRIELQVEAIPIDHNLPFGREFSLANLPKKDLNLKVLAQKGDEPPVVSEVEVELATHESVSVLLITDVYGRFAPRAILNGLLD